VRSVNPIKEGIAVGFEIMLDPNEFSSAT